MTVLKLLLSPLFWKFYPLLSRAWDAIQRIKINLEKDFK